MEIDPSIFQYARSRSFLSNQKLWHLSAFMLFCAGISALYLGIERISTNLFLISFSLPHIALIPGIMLIGAALGIAGIQFALFLSNKDSAIIRRQDSRYPQLTVESTVLLLRVLNDGHLPPIQRLLRKLSQQISVREVFSRIGIRVQDFSFSPTKQNKESDTQTPPLVNGMSNQQTEDIPLETILEHAKYCADIHKHPYIRVSDLVVACFLGYPPLIRWYQQHDLTREDILRLSEWIELSRQEASRARKFWDLRNLVNHPPIGLNWIYGFTPVLSQAAIELTEWTRVQASHRIVGRQSEIELVEAGLNRGNDANILLVGSVGVGKKTIIEGCAERITSGVSPLLGNRIFEISGEVFSQMSENDALVLASEALNAGNIILAIPNIHLVESNEESPQSKILKQLAESNRIHLIISTDPRHYHEVLERNSGFLRYFSTIEVREPELEDVREILQKAIPGFESRHRIFFSFSAIERLIQNAIRFLPNAPFPEKAMDTLESIGAWMKQHKTSFVTPEIVNQVFTETFHVPAATAGESERAILLAMPKLMHEQIIGQNSAITAISQSLQRIRSGIERAHKPIGSFLFLGPTGVGKTETAKTLARAYFGSESAMLRFDMSEYQNAEGVGRFIGSVASHNPGSFPSAVRDNPFSVILLDEIEKAYHDLLNLFLQVLDEGNLTDAFGEKVSFTQNIVIATSNAGSEFIRELQPKENESERTTELVIEHILHQHIFSPELINRFDDIIIFKPLSRNELKQIASLQIKALTEQLKTKGYLFEPTESILEAIVDLGYDPQFGARPMVRAITNTLETIIAQKILSDSVEKGTPFTVTQSEIDHITNTH